MVPSAPCLAGLRIPDEDVRELAERVCRARPAGINGSWMNRAQMHPDQAFRCLFTGAFFSGR